MYKIFLSLRYLRKLLMAYFAILCVAMCVAMMLIVVSVMNGFLEKIETSAKGVFGDVIIEARDLARYDDFITTLKQDVPQVVSATPFILANGTLSIPSTDYNQGVQIAGIRLPQCVSVNDFEKGLFVQRNRPKPTFDPNAADIINRLEEEAQTVRDIFHRELGDDPSSQPPEKLALGGKLLSGIRALEGASANLQISARYQKRISELQNRIDKASARAAGRGSDKLDDLTEQMLRLEKESGLMSPANRIILGLGLPSLSFRTPRGETVRMIAPGHKVVLSVMAPGKKMVATDVSFNSATMTIVDDCSTDVAPIDSSFVYVPFKTLQELNNMGATYSSEPPYKMVSPAQCSQIHVKVAEPFTNGQKLLDLRNLIERSWLGFLKRYPDAASSGANIQTWRQFQAKLIGSIETQRTLSVIMFGIVSLVSVVLIFVIFYMLVYQKIRDIGVLKAIGASSAGITSIFLAYGAAVGLCGAILGTIGGYYFVHYINEIQDAVDRWCGFRVWERDVFMFEKIPNQVEFVPAAMIIIGAIIAGLLGALLPAIRAGRMQPVEALRYE